MCMKTLEKLVHTLFYCIWLVDATVKVIDAELEIAVGHWPFSDQFALFGRANPIC